MKKLLLSLCMLVPLLAASIVSQAAQVSNVRFLIRYNGTTCKYDVLMYLETGNINTPGVNVSFQAVGTNQLSLVVPTGSSVGGNTGGTGTVTTIPNEPRTGGTVSSGVYSGGSPLSWAQTNRVLAPGAMSGSDIYAFVANPSGAYWPQASQGDTILLFSLTIVTPTANCGQGIRIWNNNQIKGSPVSGGDPASSATGFSGNDYNNGILIGSAIPLFNGTGTPNLDQAKPTVTANVTANATSIFGTSSASTSSCYTITGYSWTGPNSYTASTQNFTRTPSSGNLGNYVVTVTNSLGCTATASKTIVLPVHLLSFNGNTEGCNAHLTWEVAAGQLDLEAFDVQYSSDGSHFETIGHLERNPNSDLYTFSYGQAPGKGFYRLMIIERSGVTEYTKTISVTTDCAAAPITIAPNPTQGRTVVSGISAGDQIKVTDVLGNVIANYISSGNTAVVDLAIYPAGIYSVLVSRNNQILKTDKVSKQ